MQDGSQEFNVHGPSLGIKQGCIRDLAPPASPFPTTTHIFISQPSRRTVNRTFKLNKCLLYFCSSHDSLLPISKNSSDPWYHRRGFLSRQDMISPLNCDLIMSTLASTNRTRVQKVCTLWTHDENFSRETVVFNDEKFPELKLNPGALVQIIGLRQASSVRDYAKSQEGKIFKSNGSTRSEQHYARSRSRRSSMRVMLDESGAEIPGGRELDQEKSYIFVAKPMAAELKTRQPGLQVMFDDQFKVLQLTRVCRSHSPRRSQEFSAFVTVFK